MKVLFFAGAFSGGVAVSFINYLILLPTVKNSGDKRSAFVSPLRSVLAAAYLFVLYFIGNKYNVSTPFLLIAGALGLTVSLVLFTALLLRSNKRGGENNNNNERE